MVRKGKEEKGKEGMERGRAPVATAPRGRTVLGDSPNNWGAL